MVEVARLEMMDYMDRAYIHERKAQLYDRRYTRLGGR